MDTPDIIRFIFDCAVPTLDEKDIKFEAPFYGNLCRDYLKVNYKKLSQTGKRVLVKHAKEIYFGKRRILENPNYYINKI